MPAVKSVFKMLMNEGHIEMTIKSRGKLSMITMILMKRKLNQRRIITP